MKTYVIMNVQHKLFPEQLEILDRTFRGNWEYFYVPANGWTLEEQLELADQLQHKGDTVFASPVPVMLGRCVAHAVEGEALGGTTANTVHVFHNDSREKKELPGGKIIQTVAPTGWKLVTI